MGRRCPACVLAAEISAHIPEDLEQMRLSHELDNQRNSFLSENLAGGDSEMNSGLAYGVFLRH